MPHTQRWSPLMVYVVGPPAPSLFSSALMSPIYRKTNLHSKLTVCKLPPPSSHYWSFLSDLWICLPRKQRESTAWDNWLKITSAAYAKINKGGMRQMNAKNLTPKYRTRWCMGKIPRDWRCSKVPMNQMLHSPMQALVAWKGISCDEQDFFISSCSALVITYLTNSVSGSGSHTGMETLTNVEHPWGGTGLEVKL